MFLSFVFLLGQPAFAAYLTISETSSTEMKMPPGAPPQMAAMMKQYAPKPEATKIYVSGGRWAEVGSQTSNIMNYDDETQIHVDHKKKTYTQTPMDYWVEHSPMGKSMENARISGVHQDMKKNKKVLGKTCQMVSKTIEVSGMSYGTEKTKAMKDHKFKMTSYDCVLTSPPAAWQEYMKATEKYWKIREKKLKKKFKSFDMDNKWFKGLVLLSATNTDMVASMSPEQAKMMPKTTRITKVTALNEKPFSPVVFQPPAGYKKTDPTY